MTDGNIQLAGEGVAKAEIGYMLVASVLAIILAIDFYRRGRLSAPALCFIAGFSIFWQEFYADWGAYLLWSSKFAYMEFWPSTLWTTPIKPWRTMLSYPVFMCVAVSTMVFLANAVQRRFPSIRPWRVSLLVAAPILYLFNVAMEYHTVVRSGKWTYVDVIGPALTTGKGSMPLLWPGIPFALWGATIAHLIRTVDGQSRPAFEGWIMRRPSELRWIREATRAGTWVLVRNVSYWLILCTPLIAIRLLFGQPNPLVP